MEVPFGQVGPHNFSYWKFPVEGRKEGRKELKERKERNGKERKGREGCERRCVEDRPNFSY
jgi:hypothetical protein